MHAAAGWVGDDGEWLCEVELGDFSGVEYDSLHVVYVVVLCVFVCVCDAFFVVFDAYDVFECFGVDD